MSKYDQIGMGERAPWGDFPSVIRNADLKTLSNEPEYQAAKGGNEIAAITLVKRILTDATVAAVRELIGADKPRLVPVLAVEEAGHNKLPLAIAEILADRLGLDVELNITQKEQVSRTGTKADHRLAFTPTFKGKVQPGQKYFLIDDTLTMGGTIASLRGWRSRYDGASWRCRSRCETGNAGGYPEKARHCHECLLAGDFWLWNRPTHPRRSRASPGKCVC